MGFADDGLKITLGLATPTSVYPMASLPVEPGSWDADTSLLGDSDKDKWTLFLSDVDFGEQAQFSNSGLMVMAVPEPGTFTLGAVGLAVFAFMRLVRQRN